MPQLLAPFNLIFQFNFPLFRFPVLSPILCNKVDGHMADSSDSEIHTCVLSSLAHPTYFPWGLGQWTRMAMATFFYVAFEVCFSGSLNGTCYSWQTIGYSHLIFIPQ